MTIEELNARLLDLTVRVIRVTRALPRSPEARHVAGQLLRCGSSPGANYEEACGAESRADFAHKLGIVLKELKETRYWLRVIQRVPLLEDATRVDPLLEEVDELARIFAASHRTAKRPSPAAPSA